MLYTSTLSGFIGIVIVIVETFTVLLTILKFADINEISTFQGLYSKYGAYQVIFSTMYNVINNI